MTPGPVPVPPNILKVLSEPVVHHRTESFSKTINSVLLQLTQVFQTKNPSLTLNGWGTTGMEAALVNTLSPGDELLVIEAGKFGERWTEIANAYHIKPIVLKIPWGKIPSLDQVEELIKKNPKAKALACQACETSTGVSFPIQKMGELIAKTDMLFIVDAITALGAYPMPMDDWQLDVVIGGSQKAFMLPAGLSFISLSQKAWQHNKSSKLPKYTLDLAAELEANNKQQTQFSSSTSMLLALDEVLKLMLNPSLNDFFKTTQKRSDYFKKKCIESGLKIFGESPSTSLTVIEVPAGIDGEKIQKSILQNHNILVAGGQDQLKGKILRVGHMGHMTLDDLDETLTAIKKTLA